MLVHLKPLIVLWLLGAVVLFAGRRALCPAYLPPDRLNKYALLVVGITSAAFLSQHFLIYSVVSALLVWRLSAGINPAALLAATLFCTPAYNFQLVGLGAGQLAVYKVQYIFAAIAFIRYWGSQEKNTANSSGKINGLDVAVLAWVAHQTIVNFHEMSLTVALKYLLFEGAATFAIYYVFARAIKCKQDFQEVIAVLVLAFAFMAFVAVFESARHWLLYSTLEDALKIVSGTSGYSIRSGMLRARSSASHPIVLGGLLGVGLMLACGLTESKKNFLTYALMSLLVAGMVASYSRGPWVATFVAFMIFMMAAPRRISNMSKAMLVIAVVVTGLALTDAGQRLLDLLPWIGKGDSETIDYRNQLVAVSWSVFLESPWLGSLYYMYDPMMLQLMQGEGIVDMVNSYLGLALSFGVVGLMFFVLPILLALIKVGKTALQSDFGGGRAIFAALVCYAITLVTVSNIAALTLIMWVLVGLSYSASAIAPNKRRVRVSLHS